MDLEVAELDVLQADVDDESPQVLAALIERALQEGALDAHLTPLTMKKSRPGTRVEILCRPDQRDAFIRMLLLETSTLGVKARRVERYAMPRRFEPLEVDGQPVRMKVALLDGQPVKAMPEFEDCRRAAAALGLPVREVIRRALTSWESGRRRKESDSC